ncbi:hypothetical protein S7711_02028 [Stachybotrys chartarum IBT 7711]|uniref:IMS import disulfide relay-system CHCH-CHCH-like Cx9C domain-containing protein n=1 Tax=Stachybotrys chartarum (strain CBS 109288 / IBT 7711) TaxID=1280523 RepID=A0A084AW11_STACB|nr:hypothetical protein S7711_02028 [Stachybotrys chartarum IBT 7711]
MTRTATRPIQKFAKAVSQCSAEASAYGKCIVADYNAVHKNQCAKEFMRLKDCYLVSLQPMASLHTFILTVHSYTGSIEEVNEKKRHRLVLDFFFSSTAHTIDN